jgi:Domain of unknown function (DUF4167)
MRNGHHQNNNHKRMRGRHQHHNNRKSQNPLTRSYESNGPDVKIRGTAATIAEKYIQLARDAQSSGDPVAAENYYQHAEHYFRLIAAAQEQFRQQNPGQQFNQPLPGNVPQGGSADDVMDEGDEEFQQAGAAQNEPYAREQPQPYMPRENPQIESRQQPQGRQSRAQPQPPASEISGLPSFITGAQPQLNLDQGAQNGQSANGQDERNGDRFPLHRRRRRHRGNRPDFGQSPAEGSDEQPSE